MMDVRRIWIICGILSVAVSQSGAQRLEIFPNQDVITKPVGSNIVFTCNVLETDDSQDHDLKWFNANNDEITEVAGRVYIERPDEQSLKLYIQNIQKEDAGQYTCTGKIEGTDVQDTIQLDLFQDITFENAPSPQHPVMNTDALITCVVTGQPAPEVSWRYQGEKIENDERYSIDPTVGLRIKMITEEDNGRYECRAEVAATGRFDKRDIDVIVHTLPTITQELGDTEGIELQETAIECKADGNPPPQYRFYRDDNEFPVEDQDDRVFVDEAGGVIHFRPLDRTDQGNYRCEAYNAAGNVDSVGYLDVIVPPKVYRYDNVTEAEGNTVSLTCYSEGEPSPDMSFRKVGLGYDYELGENENGRIVVELVQSGQLKLTIDQLEPQDTSNYTCKSRNSGGFAEQNGTIIVEFAPRFPADQTTEFYGWAGKVRNVTCMTQAEPVPEIEWWQYNEKLENNETFRIIPLLKNSVLQIYPRDEDSNWIYSKYTCKARNTRGENDLEVRFNRAMEPDTPSDVNALEESPTTLVLGVTPGEDDGGMPVISYRVSTDTHVRDYGVHEEIRIENLRPSTRYLFLVSARNEVGASAPYEYVHEMPEVRVPYPIVIVSDPHGLYPYEYTLQWEKPRTGGNPIIEYEFSRRMVKVHDDSFNVAEGLEDWVVKFKQDDQDKPMQSYKLEGLKPDQHYEARIRARNSIGWSELNSEFVFLTAQDFLRPVRDVATTVKHSSLPFVSLVLSAIVAHLQNLL